MGTLIQPEEILSLQAYERVREDRRRAIIEEKRHRRVEVGEFVTFVFENRATALFQIQEILRAEGVTDPAAIREEIEAYDVMVPRPGELRATMLIEIDDRERRRQELERLVGIEKKVAIEVGGDRIPAEFHYWRETETAASPVNYAIFSFDPAAVSRFADPGVPAALVIEHPNYRAQAAFDGEVRAVLAGELRGQSAPAAQRAVASERRQPSPSIKTRRVTLIPGDGIGPEVVAAATRVLEAAGAQVEWERVEAGGEVMAKYGTPLPDQVLESVRKTRVALKGPVTTPIAAGFASVNVELRKQLDLYANLRRARNVPGVRTPFSGVDIIVVRENTEGIYSGLEHVVTPGVVESLRIITEHASTRIAEYAFQLADRLKRRKVTAVHKANIMKLGDGLFLDCVRRVASRFPHLEYGEMIIDNCCMQLVMRPQQFDVLVMENFHGDIISELCAGLVGGTGVVSGANMGEGIAVFEAVHGSAPDIAGKNLANPSALIFCAVEMLEHIGQPEIAKRVFEAVCQVLAAGKTVTRDLGGRATTTEMTDAVIAALGTVGAATS
jgi:isocitrate dehydrogenase (NAD+)